MSQSAENKLPICVTIAHPLVLAADRVAEQLDRSRSWVFSRALESFLAPNGSDHESGGFFRPPGAAGLVPPRPAAPVNPRTGAATFSETERPSI